MTPEELTIENLIIKAPALGYETVKTLNNGDLIVNFLKDNDSCGHVTFTKHGKLAFDLPMLLLLKFAKA